MAGAHLPAFAAAESGLFTERGLDVAFLDWVYGPGRSIRSFGADLRVLAEGGADFALTSVAYLLAGLDESNGSLGARFAAVFHQRNPIAGLVAEQSDLRVAADLPGRRTVVAGSWFARDYACALARMGLGPPAEVASPGDLRAALARGEIDVVPAWVDMVAIPSEDGSEVRPVPLDVDVYASGLAAADRLPLELVARMRDALVAGFALQRERPEVGIAAFRRRFPSISEEHARTAWSLFEPYAFGAPATGAMEAPRWRATIEYTAAAQGLIAAEPERVYRPELLAG